LPTVAQGCAPAAESAAAALPRVIVEAIKASADNQEMDTVWFLESGPAEASLRLRIGSPGDVGAIAIIFAVSLRVHKL